MKVSLTTCVLQRDALHEVATTRAVGLPVLQPARHCSWPGPCAAAAVMRWLAPCSTAAGHLQVSSTQCHSACLQVQLALCANILALCLPAL